MLQPGRDIFPGAQRRENIETKISEGPADCLKVKILIVKTQNEQKGEIRLHK